MMGYYISLRQNWMEKRRKRAVQQVFCIFLVDLSTKIIEKEELYCWLGQVLTVKFSLPTDG